jgi:hypothetical protein
MSRERHIASIALGFLIALTAPRTADPQAMYVDQSRAHTKRDCEAFQRAKPSLKSAVGGEVKGILDDTDAACTALLKDGLATPAFMERVWKLERRAATQDAPPGFSKLIPFQSAELFRAYDSHSLFLFPSDLDWSRGEHQPEETKRLYKQFKAFGDAIGEKRLAVWFSDEEDQPDVLRSKFYADLLGLSYSGGPYIVTTTRHPLILAKTDEAVVISLNGISPERWVNILNALERDLRTEREIHKRELLYEEVKQRLLTAADRNSDLLKGVVTKVLSIK